LTDSERTALQSCNALIEGRGPLHVQLVISWMTRMLRDCVPVGLLGEDEAQVMLDRLNTFKESYREARSLSYNETPYQYNHIFLLLVCIFCFTVPFALVDAFGDQVWIPTVVVAIAFFGLHEISRDMEKPFGFDYHDIQVDQMLGVLHSDYTATARLALRGSLLEAPCSTGGDILAALLHKHGSATSASSPVIHQYSLHRLPSFVTNPSMGKSRPASNENERRHPSSNGSHCLDTPTLRQYIAKMNDALHETELPQRPAVRQTIPKDKEDEVGQMEGHTPGAEMKRKLRWASSRQERVERVEDLLLRREQIASEPQSDGDDASDGEVEPDGESARGAAGTNAGLPPLPPVDRSRVSTDIESGVSTDMVE